MFSVLLINALGDQFGHLQAFLQTLADKPNFSSDTLLQRLDMEEVILQRRSEQGLIPAVHLSSAFPTSTSRDRQRHFCSNCKQTNHATEFCILPGGKMAGQSIDEACAAQRATLGKLACTTRPRSHSPQTAHVATTATIADVADMPSAPHPSITINGISYMPKQPTHPPSHSSANVATTTTIPLEHGDKYKYHAFLACDSSPSTVSFNWEVYSTPIDLSHITCEALSSSSRSTATQSTDCPFTFDTGATCHISPEHSDF